MASRSDSLEYQFIVFESDDTTTDFTITHARLAELPTVGGQNVDIRRGTTESRPWRITVVDNDNYILSQLADSGGRLIGMGRMIRARVSKNGGAYTTLATGRITNITINPGDVTLTVQDERWKERGAEIWTDIQRDDDWPSTGAKKKAGTYLLPLGIAGDYGDFELRAAPHPLMGTVRKTNGNLAMVALDQVLADGGGLPLKDYLNPRTVDFIREDIKDNPDFENTNLTAGNFDKLRCLINGTEREVAGVGQYVGRFNPPIFIDQHEVLDTLLITPTTLLHVWVVWPGASGSVTSAFLYAPTHEPTDMMPLHIGGRIGIHPFRMVRKLYDDAGVRYSTAAMDTLIDDQTFINQRFRIEAPENMYDFLNKKVYQPLGVTPFINADGEVAPEKITLPVNISSTSLFEFTSTKLAEPHPEWHQIGRDIVTRINFEWLRERQLEHNPEAGNLKTAAADMLEVEEETIISTASRGGSTGPLGVHEIDVDLSGYHIAGWTIKSPFSTVETRFPGAQDVADIFKDEIFDRFGDGPVRGTFTAMSTAESVTPGDFVRVTLPTFPSPDNQGRGNTRILQVLSRVDTPAGPDFEWLEAGPNSQALSAPTVSLLKSTVDPYNTMIATVGGLSTSSGIGWQLQTAVGSTEPSSTSEKWVWTGKGASTGANTLPGFPSGNKVWGRIRQRAPGRIRSGWSTADSSTLTALAAPSSVSISNSSGGFARFNIGISTGSTENEIEVYLGKSTSCTTAPARVGTIPAQSARYNLTGLDKGSTYCAGAKFTDPYGGRSALTSVSFQTSTSNPTAPGPAVQQLVQGTPL